MKKMSELTDMKLLQKGNRLSILPVNQNEFDAICAVGLQKDKPKSDVKAV
jgi:predicted RNA-binding protein with PUA-like domain